MTPVTTQLLAPGSVDDSELTYVVMGARYQGQWIFVRHRWGEERFWKALLRRCEGDGGAP